MFKQKSLLWYSAAALTIAIFGLFLAGCESSGSSSDDVTEETTMSISATPVSIAVGSYTVIEVIVETGTTGVEGQEVTFSVSPSTAGTLSATTRTTAADGSAAVMFTGAIAGSAVITVSASGTSLTANVGVTITEEGTTGSGTVDVSVSPQVIIANGTDEAHVTVVVRDANMNPAADSTLVKLCAGEKFDDIDGNGYWSSGIDTLIYDANDNDTWDAAGIIPSVAYTGGGIGTASVDFTAGNVTGTYYIKATVDDGGVIGSDDASIQLNPNTELHSIFLAAEVINLQVKACGGIETANLYATGYDVNGNSVPEGMAITFMILDGPDGGEFLGTDPTASEATALTNSQGIASVPIHSGTVSGTIRVRAFADTILSNATQIMVSSGPPKYIDVGVDTFNVQWWNTLNERMGVTAVVSDTFLNPVVDSTVVYFSCDEGTMVSYEARTVDHEGVTGTEWISGTTVPTADGKVWVFAETAGGTVRDSVMFINSSPIVYFYTSTASVDINADGEDYELVGISAEDINFNYVVDMTEVVFDFDESAIDVEAAELRDGWNASLDWVKVTSAGALKQDFSLTGGNDDGIVKAVGVKAEDDLAFATLFTVTLHSGNAYSANCEISGEETAAQGAQLSFDVKIADRAGNPLGDHTLVLTASAGSIGTGTCETNEYGECSGLTWTAPGAAGTVTITVTDTDPRGGIVLTKTVTVE
ncbi:MAG: hypothetical protein AB1483_06670 [Candidatus Zixiibacteriota bacterium]